VWARRSIDEAERCGSETALGYAENVLGIALTTLGEPGAIEHFRRALARFEDLGDLQRVATVLSNMGVAEYFEGRWSEAVELYERAAGVSERFGDPVLSANQRMNVGEVLVDQGCPQEAEPLLREASRVWRATGEDYGLGFCLIQLGRVAAISGGIDEALSRFRQARERYLHVGASGQVLEVDAREIECRLLTGEPDGALPRIEDTVARLEVEGGVNVLMPLLARLRGYALAQLGRLDAAGEAFEYSVDRARERGAQHEVALSLQGLARIARKRGEPSAEIEAEVEAIFERLGIRAVLLFPMTASGSPEAAGAEGADRPLPPPIVAARR
jgi:tetratricopeptide (TPR) repeat protein